MTTRKDDTRKPAQDPKKVRTDKDQTVELQVEELEERISPLKTF